MTENLVTVKGRQVQKHDIEANWIKAGNAEKPFIPLKGEIIIYDGEIDNEGNVLELPEGRNNAYKHTRQKIGDGIHNVNELPFVTIGRGDSDGSITQESDDNLFRNYSYAIAGSSLGYNTISGSKGYRISAFTPGEQDDAGNYINGTYTLVLDEGEVIPQEIINTPYCIYLKQSKDNVGTISSINGNIITVNGFLYPANWDEGKWEKLNEDGTKAKDENGNQIYLTGEEWEAAKAEAYASSYIIFEGLPTIGNINVGTGAHAEGWGNIATQIGSHAEGAESKALGKYSHAEGNGSVAYYSAHSEGKYAEAIGYHSHAEGYQTKAEGMDSHAEGRTTKAIGQDSHAEGRTTIAEGLNSHAEGQNTLAQGQSSHAEGGTTKAIGIYSHAEGFETEASNSYNHAEGLRTKATAAAAHAEGGNSQATGMRSHAEGLNTIASGANSHTEGSSTKASSDNAHAEGSNTNASGGNAHAEGSSTVASGGNSHAEGGGTKAVGNNSHAEGQSSIAYGNYSHAGGMNSTTGILNEDGTVVTNSGAYAFSHGYQTAAKGRGSVALGRDTIATEEFQTVVGSFNDPTAKDARFVVGTGDKASNLKNGFIVYKDGRAAVLADPKNPLDVATKQYVDNNIHEEFIAFIDIYAETTQEEIQEALDAVYGTAILAIKEEAWPSFYLTLSKNIKELYINNDGWGGMLDITGSGKYSDTIIFADQAGLTELYISDVSAVYNSDPMFGTYNSCKTVVNCSGASFINCDYLYNIYLYEDHPDHRSYSISNALNVSKISTNTSDSGDSISISNCVEIDGLSIDAYPLDGGETHSCTFYKCNSIKNVSITDPENITDEDIKLEYNDCNFIDPLSVYKAPNHINLKEEEDFTAIIDVTSDMTIEDIQYLIDGVKGTLVLNFIDYLDIWEETLNFSYDINELYITGLCPGITLQGYSSRGHQNIFCQNSIVENATIKYFGKVYNAWPAGYIQYCGNIYDSYAQYEISDCDQLIRSGASAGAGGQGYTRITSCNSLIDCFTDLYSMINYNLVVSNCGRVDNFRISSDSYHEEGEEWYVHFNDCNFVSNVYLTSDSDTNFDIQYNNCNQIHNCYGYTEESVTQDDLSELNTSLTAKINEAKNACSPKNQSTAIILNASEGQQLSAGWYNIATLPRSSSSLLLHVRYGATGGRWSSFLLSIEMTYTAGACGSVPSIKVLNCSHRTGNSSNMNSGNYACTKARVRYDNNTSKISNNAYLDLYLPYTNALKADGTINGNVSLFAKVLSNTDEIDHATGKCTLATSFNAAEVASNEWSKEILIDTPKDQLIVSELPADPDTNTIYFIV